MKTYVMSDIHGNLELYNDILNQIDFENFSKYDRLYINGDVVDRGSSSIKILKHVMENSDKITMLLGNHELMMLTEMDKYIQGDRLEDAKDIMDKSNWCVLNGGDKTLLELLSETEEKQLEILEFVRNLTCKVILEISDKKYYIVHGRPENYYDKNDLPIEEPKSLLNKNAKYQMVWGRFPVDAENHMDEVLVFGHTCSKYYKEFNEHEHWSILKQNNYIAIDCGVAYNKEQSRLGCLRLEDLKEFYAK